MSRRSLWPEREMKLWRIGKKVRKPRSGRRVIGRHFGPASAVRRIDPVSGQVIEIVPRRPGRPGRSELWESARKDT